jgi:hypothetical protein
MLESSGSTASAMSQSCAHVLTRRGTTQGARTSRPNPSSQLSFVSQIMRNSSDYFRKPSDNRCAHFTVRSIAFREEQGHPSVLSRGLSPCLRRRVCVRAYCLQKPLNLPSSLGSDARQRSVPVAPALLPASNAEVALQLPPTTGVCAE